jgi:hypothetical protein
MPSIATVGALDGFCWAANFLRGRTVRQVVRFSQRDSLRVLLVALPVTWALTCGPGVWWGVRGRIEEASCPLRFFPRSG